jgi:putative transposase
MKDTSKWRVNGPTYIEPSINTATPWLQDIWTQDEVAAAAFFKQAIDHNGLPSKVVIDKSGANNAGLENINILIFLAGLLCFIDMLKVKYLNNIVEQDHRFIKKITKPMVGFKTFHSASATLDGIETAHMISKGHFANNQLPVHQKSIALAV